MRNTLEELDRCIRDGELGVAADEAFHVAVCNAADNKYFAAARSSMQSNILTGMNLTRNLSLTKPQTRMKLVQSEHYDIFDAIEAADQEAARQAMRNHVESARKRIFEG